MTRALPLADQGSPFECILGSMTRRSPACRRRAWRLSGGGDTVEQAVQLCCDPALCRIGIGGITDELWKPHHRGEIMKRRKWAERGVSREMCRAAMHRSPPRSAPRGGSTPLRSPNSYCTSIKREHTVARHGFGARSVGL